MQSTSEMVFSMKLLKYVRWVLWYYTHCIWNVQYTVHVSGICHYLNVIWMVESSLLQLNAYLWGVNQPIMCSCTHGSVKHNTVGIDKITLTVNEVWGWHLQILKILYPRSSHSLRSMILFFYSEVFPEGVNSRRSLWLVSYIKVSILSFTFQNFIWNLREVHLCWNYVILLVRYACFHVGDDWPLVIDGW